MTKQRAVGFLFILFLMAFTACDSGRIYDQSYTIDGAKWNRDSVYHYEVTIEDSLLLSDYYVSIRNNTDYPYSNIYLFVTTEFPNGHSTTDTIECILADKSGRWLGDGSGRIKDNLIMLQHALRFPLKGKYHFYLEQGMRDELLQGIEDIGIRIEKSN
jgi:gliding motility-associated lipoprotein GldH